MKRSSTGCMLCVQRVQRVTGEGFPSYCSDYSTGPTDPGRRIPDDKLASGPAWCPKRGSGA